MLRKCFSLLLVLSLALTGCSSLLLRDYSAVTVHNAIPKAEGDSSALRVESYQELVNALLYLVTQAQGHGIVRLYNYEAEAVEGDVEAACQEVLQEDPLGAFAVSQITYNITTIVSYYEVALEIDYRRTPEQIASIVTATGSSAIRTAMQKALSAFSQSLILRINYFDGDLDYLQRLMQEAYDASPSSALGLPSMSARVYPEEGRQRIVELEFTYDLGPTELARRQNALEREAEQLSAGFWGMEDRYGLYLAIQTLNEVCDYDPEGGGTAYHALVEGEANAEGMALALAVLCQSAQMDCCMVRGTLGDQPRFWNVAQISGIYRHLDLQESVTPTLYSDTQMIDRGYVWSSLAIPRCPD